MTAWTMTQPLANHASYYWRAVATDEHGAQTTTPLRSFTVDTGNLAPSAPTPVSPVGGTDVTTAGTATLVAANAEDGDSDPLTYRFEIDTVSTFDSSNRRTSDPIPAGSGTTVWTVDLLLENQLYYWRVKANDGRADSEWVAAQFRMDAQNEAPTTPVVANPGDRAWTATLHPTLAAHAASDPEEDPLRYRFEVYRDAAMQSLVSGNTVDDLQWQVDVALEDRTTHYWRVRAEDPSGATSAWSPVTTLFVSTGTYVPPTIALTAPATIVDVRDGLPSVAWEGTDPNIEPTVALYYDQVGDGFAGTKIVDGLQQPAGTHAGSYVWNTSGLLPGAYYVYGLIYDDRGTGRGYAPGTVVVPGNPQLGSVSATAPDGH